MYSAPTGVGKSLVYEILLFRRLLFWHGQCLIVLPFVSLLEEKRRDVSVLSSIPAGAERYREYSASRLKSLLSKANKHLLKFDKVNRKAMSQYLLFSERVVMGVVGDG